MLEELATIRLAVADSVRLFLSHRHRHGTQLGTVTSESDAAGNQERYCCSKRDKPSGASPYVYDSHLEGPAQESSSCKETEAEVAIGSRDQAGAERLPSPLIPAATLP